MYYSKHNTKLNSISQFHSTNITYQLLLITTHYYNLTTSSPCTVALVQRYVTISNPRRKVCSKLLLPSVTQYYKFTANAYLLQYTRWAKSRYTVYSFYFWWRCDPTWVMTSSFLMFLDHTQWRITFGRTPLDEWSARPRDLYLTTHNTHSRQTSMPSVGFEFTISAGELPQTYVLDRAATGTGL